MKRKDLERHLRDHGCELLREGGRHSWWHNPATNSRSAVPRHNEVNDILANKICKDLGVPSARRRDSSFSSNLVVDRTRRTTNHSYAKISARKVLYRKSCGKREINVRQMKALARRFGVSPAVFI